MDTLTHRLAGLVAAPAVLAAIERSQFIGNLQSALDTDQPGHTIARNRALASDDTTAVVGR